MTFPRSFRATRKGTWRISTSLPGFSAKPSRPKVTSKRVNDVIDVRFTIQRTTAPLGRYTTGFITLTGPTRVRIPVAIQPLAVEAPAEVAGSGATGSTDITVTPGFTGQLDLSATGLAKGEVTQDAVPAGEDHLSCLTVPEGTDLTRVDLDSADDSADLDLYLLASDTCDQGCLQRAARPGASGPEHPGHVRGDLVPPSIKSQA